jgi:magnesium-protoporphyrin IX monomethyl ester (oxidative) cyclase
MEAAKEQGGVMGGLKRAFAGVQTGFTFISLYFLPTLRNEAPADVRLAPVW